jgi:triosephosphate isomerase
MLLEALVVGTCLAGRAGCGSATNAYYEQNVELKQTVKNIEKYGQKIADNNKYIVFALTPVAAVATGKPVAITLARHLVLNIDIKKQAAGLLWSW